MEFVSYGMSLHYLHLLLIYIFLNLVLDTEFLVIK